MDGGDTGEHHAGDRAAPTSGLGSGLGPSRLGPGYTSGTRATRRRVFVDLDRLYGDPPAPDPPAPDDGPPASGSATVRGEQVDRSRDDFAGADGQRSVRRPGRLICSGEVPGVLTGWERDHCERWVAIVSFTIPFTGGDPRPGKRMELVALPLAAVRPADPGSPPPRPPTVPDEDADTDTADDDTADADDAAGVEDRPPG